MSPSPRQQETIRIRFLGTGEACDPQRRNTSILVDRDNHSTLLDCGFTAAQGFIALNPAPVLENIWISHLHGDHFFSLPQLLAFFYQEKRERPLTILCGSDITLQIRDAINLAYPDLITKLGFALDFTVIPPGQHLQHLGLTWSTAPVIHGEEGYGLRLSGGGKSIYYSGDGTPSEEATSLMAGCDLIIHEAFSLSMTNPKHFSIRQCLELAQKTRPRYMALVHLNQQARKQLQQEIFTTVPQTQFLLPEDGDVFNLF